MKVGEQIRHKSGALMTVVGYRGYKDIDIRFDFKNGKSYVAEHKRVDQFTPTMKYPSRFDYVGMTAFNKHSGKQMEIIEYRTYKDISVRFEDGVINDHTSVEQFKKGAVKDPSISQKELVSSKIKNKPKTKVRKRQSERYIGKSTKCKNGLIATVTDWRTSNDFDVTFEDGVIAEHVAIGCFKNGTIRHPDIRVATDVTTPKIERVGETRIHEKTGMMMEIIRYGGAQDIDIKFEDGTIVRHKVYANFKKGKIQYPDEKSRLGEVIYVPRVGLSLKVIAYRAAKDIDVEYEDGEIITSVNYKMIRKSPPRHPIFDAPKRKTIGNFELIGLAFRTNKTPYFYCRRLDAENSSLDVVAPREILEENEEKQCGKRKTNGN